MDDRPHGADAVLDFTGRTVMVIGGSSGIGNGIAHAFRERGAEVVVSGTRARAADYDGVEGSLLAGLGYLQLDAADSAAVAACELPPRLDVLVQAQGTVLYGRQEFEDEAFRRVVDVNLNSVMACGSRFFPLLRESRGSMVVISSIAGYKGAVGNPAYAASKAGAISLTRSLAAAWAVDGVRVNGIAPGLVATKLTKVTTDHPKRLDATLRRVPLGRIGTPADMAGVALFLASPLAAYVTGHTIPVDGGLSA
ncbi:MAG: 3-oxoacyl-ACP reductase [Rhizobacter sp.]|nr:3-oxoacyl-ACP reductase [Rhizobacter sp.]